MAKKGAEEINTGKKPCRLNITFDCGHVFHRQKDINHLDWSQFTLEPKDEFCDDKEAELAEAAKEAEENRKQEQVIGTVIAQAVAKAVVERQVWLAVLAVAAALQTEELVVHHTHSITELCHPQ